MLVRVYRLRRHGARLPSAEVRAGAHLRGEIWVTREPGGVLGEWHRVAILRQPAQEEILDTLHQVQLQAWDKRGILLSGIEEIAANRRETKRYRQAWFVIPDDGAPGEDSKHDDLDSDEEREQLLEAMR